jgi:deoxyadenosine/deoxycytidine kinase
MVVKSDRCDIKYKKVLKLFYRKMKRFCFVVDCFYLDNKKIIDMI